MQADLLMGFKNSEKMVGKKTINSQGTQGSHRDDALNGGSNNKSFSKLVSKLTEESCSDSENNEHAKTDPKNYMGEEISQSMLSELMPLIETVENSNDSEKQMASLDTLLLAAQNMSDSNTETAFQSDDGDPAAEEMMTSALMESGRSIGGAENVVSGNSDNQIKAPSEKVSQLAPENNGLVSNGVVSGGGDESVDLQTVDLEKKANSIQTDAFKRDSEESQKGTLPIAHGTKGHTSSGEENPLKDNSGSSLGEKKHIFVGSNTSYKNSDNMATENFSGKISEANEDGDYKNIAASNNIEKDLKVKYGAVSEGNRGEKNDSLPAETKFALNDAHLDGGGDSSVKFNAEKMSLSGVETKTTERPQQLNQTEIIQQIVDKAKLSTNKEHNEITIKLKPEVLGNIRLNISTENHHVTIKVMADSTAVKEVLENNLHHLKNGFVNQGLEIGSFDVTVDDEPQGFYKGQNFSGFHRNRRQAAGQKKFVWSEVDSEEARESGPSPLRQLGSEKDRIDYYI